MTTSVNYRIGIDVGTHSVGFSAVALDEHDVPERLLSSVVLRHDSGLDPANQKYASTRKMVSGVARRTRRRYRVMRDRLKKLDTYLTSLGWPLVNLEEHKDPYHPWKVRAALTTAKVANATEAKAMLAIAVRHMARHRGWRNPYQAVESLIVPQEPSAKFLAFKTRVEEKVGRTFPDDATASEMLAACALTPQAKIRGNDSLLGGTLEQRDYARELRKMADVQGLDENIYRNLIKAVFAAKSPKGSALGRVGKDCLPGQGNKLRALKAHASFERYRIVSVLANLRIVEGNSTRVLTVAERSMLLDNLWHVGPEEEPTWDDIAVLLDVPRDSLKGTATPSADGERPSSRPPMYVTGSRISGLKLKPVRDWWKAASADERDAFVAAVSDASSEVDESPATAAVDEFLQSLSPEELLALEGLSLPAGRAAYSVDSLTKLTTAMLENEWDLHEARKRIFGVDDSWRPPADPIGLPVGNPAVDRVTKAVARFIHAAEYKWGMPQSVTIEHVRNGLMSEKVARETDRANNKRYAAREAYEKQMMENGGITSKIRNSDIRRYQAVERQNGQCVYCGDEITFHSCEMDHIVPRAGVGCTNRRDNLVAACRRCNHSKLNRPFAVWASNDQSPAAVTMEGTIGRVRMWLQDPGWSVREHRKFQQSVIHRLKRTEADEPLDERSMESVAWMANELRHRMEGHFAEKKADTKVAVYRGALTAEARKASGLIDKIHFIGGGGKTRLDRRHHALDALVVSLINPSVAKTLAERLSLRDQQMLYNQEQTWKVHTGSTPAAREKYEMWLHCMDRAAELFNSALDNDQVAVTQNLRLRLGNGKAHDDKVRPFNREVKLGDEIPDALIDRASTPALWCALTRHPDYVAGTGLPANPERSIRVNGAPIKADERLELFGTGSAAIAVRGGYAEIGDSVHHARIYKLTGGKKPSYGMVRVYGVDLLPHQHEDLFTAPLPPKSISMRTADPKVRKAINDGTAEYLTWIVVDDELELDMSSQKTGQVGELLEAYPGTSRWVVAGFKDPAKLRLRPLFLSSEGLGTDACEGAKKILSGDGWRPATNVVFGSCTATLIRRGTLGAVRAPDGTGRTHLPTSRSFS